MFFNNLNLSAIIFVILFNIHSYSEHKMIKWRAISENSRKVIPILTKSNYKGQMGRIGILGGSEEYTGAPYYAGKASLLLGADLSFIFCAETATIPIKSYSPERKLSFVLFFYTCI